MKIKIQVILFAVLLLTGGCVQVRDQVEEQAAVTSPTVVFTPSDGSYLLACVNEVQGLKQKEFKRYFREAADRLSKGGDDRDRLQFICLSLHQRADDKQFQQGEELFRQYINGHPDATADMEGLLVLFKRLGQARATQRTLQNKLVKERDELAVEVETLQEQIIQEQGRIQELESQIDQLKNIENIIKNRER